MTDFHYTGRISALDVAVGYTTAAELASDAVRKHDADPIAAHILGRALAASVLLSGTLRKNERLNLCWKYEGDLKTVLVDVGADGTARGLISPPHLSRPDLAGTDLFGDGGEVRVTTSQDGKVSNSGTVRSVLQDAVGDLSYFMCISNQVETEMCVMISFSADAERPVSLCRGIMLQALPGAELAVFNRLRERLHTEETRALLAHPGEADNHFENIVNSLTRGLADDPRLHLVEAPAPRFQCTCTRDKMGAVLRALPYSDRMDMARKRDDVTVKCRFCNTPYVLTIDDCIRAWNTKPPGETSG